MINVINKGKTEDYVYDIQLDGTVVNAMGLNVASNTDGFNFQLPVKDYQATPVFLDYSVPQETGENDAFSEDDLLWVKNLENGSFSCVKLSNIIENNLPYDYEVLTSQGYVRRDELSFAEC